MCTSNPFQPPRLHQHVSSEWHHATYGCISHCNWRCFRYEESEVSPGSLHVSPSNLRKVDRAESKQSDRNVIIFLPWGLPSHSVESSFNSWPTSNSTRLSVLQAGHSMAVGVLMDVKPTTLAQQKTFNGRPFPLILSPTSSDENLHISKFQQYVTSNKDAITAELKAHGAILFRGFPVATAEDFNEIVETFGWEEFPYVGGAAPRTNVIGRVFTSNESPPDQIIPFHHEMAQVPVFPAKLFFYCDVEAQEEGETPLLLSTLLAAKMEESQPEFVKKLKDKGLVYTRVLPKIDDPTSAIGRGWISTFHTTDKAEAEQKSAKLGVSLEWLPDENVKTVTSVLPGLREDEESGQLAWFNSMVAAYTGWKDSRNVPEKAVTFGDSTPLPPEAVKECLRLMEDLSVAIQWKKGDVLLIDNHLVQHSRRSFVPPRRVLAALTK